MRAHPGAPPVLTALLGLLAATPVLLPWGTPPVVTAVAELWVAATAGFIALVLGLRAWAEAPLNVAAFESADRRRSPWPELLVFTAATAGLLSAFIGVVQVLAPDALNGGLGLLMQASHLPGRAVGHLRQPNHLATVLLWGAVAWAVLQAQWRLPALPAWAGMALLMVAVVLTGSRTGLLGVAFLWAWAMADRRLRPDTRGLLWGAPVMAACVWLALDLWKAHSQIELGVTSRWTGDGSGDISSSRFAIWRNAWTLIEAQPWAGVGWGRFNVAWTLTPMTDRPPALFGHAHNLPLHLMVELGVVLGLACCGALLGLVLLGARRAWSAAPAAGGSAEVDEAGDGIHRRAALVMLGIVGWHSLLEYPLWYAYLGVPAALALFVCLGWDRPWGRAARWQALLLITGGAALLLCSAWAYSDYRVVRSIYAPGPNAAPLAQRIGQGQSARWFADQAHYAHATTHRPVPGQAWDAATTRAFERAPRVLLDPRLMMAWADALAARHGPHDRDQARYLAARLREFNTPAAQAWLQACTDPQAPAHRRFVCESPEQPWTWRDFGVR